MVSLLSSALLIILDANFIVLGKNYDFNKQIQSLFSSKEDLKNRISIPLPKWIQRHCNRRGKNRPQSYNRPPKYTTADANTTPQIMYIMKFLSNHHE